MDQEIHQYNDPQGGVQTIQDWSLSLIQSKLNRDVIVIVYVEDTLVIGEKPELIDTIEFIKKEHSTR